ncbi:hypothetical protein [Nonomuraea sp. KM90]|uniref:hypothetical protein n=1 Tax=Nonomuraea sp. KM90 TaxID=3457428 RepID=UPI003FCC8130
MTPSCNGFATRHKPPGNGGIRCPAWTVARPGTALYEAASMFTLANELWAQSELRPATLRRC